MMETVTVPHGLRNTHPKEQALWCTVLCRTPSLANQFDHLSSGPPLSIFAGANDGLDSRRENYSRGKICGTAMTSLEDSQGPERPEGQVSSMGESQSGAADVDKDKVPGSAIVDGQDTLATKKAAAGAESDEDCMIMVDEEPEAKDVPKKQEPKDEEEKSKGKDQAKQTESGKKRKGMGAFSHMPSSDVR